jgi:hypothetical protein
MNENSAASLGELDTWGWTSPPPTAEWGVTQAALGRHGAAR